MVFGTGAGRAEQIARLREAIGRADAIVVGAGAGMSTAAGFDYAGERFERYFSDFASRFGIRDMYSGGFYPFDKPEQYWAYWSRYIYVNRYLDTPMTAYYDLLNQLKTSNYFVLTTNVDHCFQRTGFDKDRLFYTQGDYGQFQCSAPCCEETFANELAVREMVCAQKDMEIPTALIPTCPHCGRPLVPNLRSDERFVEDAGWHRAAERYAAFLRNNQYKNVLYLELGVGFNTPGIIKYPFLRMTAQNPNATYACINRGETGTLPELEERSILLDADIAGVLRDLKK